MINQELKKKEIIDISTEVIYNDGLNETKILEINSYMGIPKRTFYKYFKNIDEVINEYIKNHFLKLAVLTDYGVDKYKTNREKILFFAKLYFILKNRDRKFQYIFTEFLKIFIDKEKPKDIKVYDYFNENQKIVKLFLEKGIDKKEFINFDIDKISFEITLYFINSEIVYSENKIKKEQNILSNIEKVLDSISHKR